VPMPGSLLDWEAVREGGSGGEAVSVRAFFGVWNRVLNLGLSQSCGNAESRQRQSHPCHRNWNDR
jgi:hypothetical protein